MFSFVLKLLTGFIFFSHYWTSPPRGVSQATAYPKPISALQFIAHVTTITNRAIKLMNCYSCRSVLIAFFLVVSQAIMPTILTYYFFEYCFIGYVYAFSFGMLLFITGGIGIIVGNALEKFVMKPLENLCWSLMCLIFRDPNLILWRLYYFLHACYLLLFIFSVSYRLLILMDHFVLPIISSAVMPVAYCIDADSDIDSDGSDVLVDIDTIHDRISRLVEMHAEHFFHGVPFTQARAAEHYGIAEDIIFYNYDENMPAELSEKLSNLVCKELLVLPKYCLISAREQNPISSIVNSKDYDKHIFEVLLYKAYLNFVFFNPNTFSAMAEEVSSESISLQKLQAAPLDTLFCSITTQFYANADFTQTKSFTMAMDDYFTTLCSSNALASDFLNEYSNFNWFPSDKACLIPKIPFESASSASDNLVPIVINEPDSNSFSSSSASDNLVPAVANESVLNSPLSPVVPDVLDIQPRVPAPEFYLEITPKDEMEEFQYAVAAKKKLWPELARHNAAVFNSSWVSKKNFAEEHWHLLNNDVYHNKNNTYTPELVVVRGYKHDVFPLHAKVNGDFEMLGVKNRACLDKLALAHENRSYFSNFLRGGIFVDNRGIDESKAIIVAMETKETSSQD